MHVQGAVAVYLESRIRVDHRLVQVCDAGEVNDRLEIELPEFIEDE